MSITRSIASLTVTLALLSFGTARAEVFKVEGTGVESCGDFHRIKFNARNNVDTWVGMKANGTFIQDSIFVPGCMSRGKLKTTERSDP